MRLLSLTEMVRAKVRWQQAQQRCRRQNLAAGSAKHLLIRQQQLSGFNIMLTPSFRTCALMDATASERTVRVFRCRRKSVPAVGVCGGGSTPCGA